MDGVQGQLVMTREDFGDELWNSVGKMLKLLTDSNYQCKVRCEEVDTVVIEYNYDERLEYGDKIVLMSYSDFEDFILWKRSLNDIENQ